MSLTADSAMGLETADWMDELFGSHSGVRLTDVAIPGTHQSATYQIGPLSKVEPGENVFYALVRPLVSNWSKSQFRSIREQLIQGIRFFDLRIAFDSKDQAIITHGLVSLPLHTILNEMSGFILEHPKEVVLIAYDLSYGYKTHRLNSTQISSKMQEVKQLLSDQFQEKLMSFRSDRTFYDFWSAGKSVMVIEQYQNFWPNGYDLNQIKAYLDESLQTQNLLGFRNLQLIYTPPVNLSTYLDLRYAFPILPEGNSLSLFSQTLRDHAVDWIRGWHQSGYKLNVVTTDFFDQFPFVGAVIDTNHTR